MLTGYTTVSCYMPVAIEGTTEVQTILVPAAVVEGFLERAIEVQISPRYYPQELPTVYVPPAQDPYIYLPRHCDGRGRCHRHQSFPDHYHR
ncbi:MAG: hypothetical protein G01um101448_189 [Parcubacteria group bacterium Gr01-1014_48]|nr:MAG: hypothetical protein Greene041614_940 [Parcubacteria group bacterium Greene0416_14]TSC74313.1 MAG: hypothetical protein G01um101448_189 [Parcubacteria group bacterium Gr01-1014_48]TSD01013.1 MAG: hypothetical protein Greene101415_514 [Parcubacteria group bacterium Greene1014_15]TSD07682.1 MAG: hypothetical protein Greene07144_836 [Parcubacteria group bacterium Greene0714_4]